MRTIHKYPVRPAPFTHPIPTGAKFLSVQTQGMNDPSMWFEVESTNPYESRHFLVFGTGFEIPADFQGTYLGTFLLEMGALVFHLFEVNTVTTVVE